MATFVFDTHRAVKDLAAAGFPEAQAEALVEIVGAAVGENAATKSDLDAMERQSTAQFVAHNRQMTAHERRMAAHNRQMMAYKAAHERWMAAHKAAHERRMAAQFAAHKRQMAALAAPEQLTDDWWIQRMEARFDAFERRITIKFAAIILSTFGLFYAAMRFIPG